MSFAMIQTQLTVKSRLIDRLKEYLAPAWAYLKLLIVWGGGAAPRLSRATGMWRHTAVVCPSFLLTGCGDDAGNVQKAKTLYTIMSTEPISTGAFFLLLLLLPSKFLQQWCHKCIEANSEWIWPLVWPGCHYEIPASPQAIFNSALSQLDHSHSQQARLSELYMSS